MVKGVHDEGDPGAEIRSVINPTYKQWTICQPALHLIPVGYLEVDILIFMGKETEEHHGHMCPFLTEKTLDRWCFH